MRSKEYAKWLEDYVTRRVVDNYVKRCERVEYELNIDLDTEYSRDKGNELIGKMTYTLEDMHCNRPLRCGISFSEGANLYKGMGSLKTAVKKYFEFCCTNPNLIKLEAGTLKVDSVSTKDSYQEFLDYFHISKKDLFEWGLAATIFPPIEQVETKWKDLKNRVMNNKLVYIRGYGRDAKGTEKYIGLYNFLFDNYNVKKDPTNNAEPQKLIASMTGLKRGENIINYQVSHIWGKTKNVLLFEAPWNICYTPKIVDPFTGHETKGNWPEEYQDMFLAKTYDMYKPYIDEYNQILDDYKVEKRLRKYAEMLGEFCSEKEVKQFEKDASDELAPIKRK